MKFHIPTKFLRKKNKNHSKKFRILITLPDRFGTLKTKKPSTIGT